MASRDATCICGAAIVWQRSVNGLWTPQNPDGSTHWANCRARDALRRKAERRNGGSGLEGYQLTMLELREAPASAQKSKNLRA